MIANLASKAVSADPNHQGDTNNRDLLPEPEGSTKTLCPHGSQAPPVGSKVAT